MIKTFRGLLADGGQDRIRLSTIKGKVGYKIVKFQLMHEEPGEQHAEHTIKIYKEEQTTIDNNVNFTDSSLLAAGYLTNYANVDPIGVIVVFDNETVNQDMYVTHEDTQGAQPCNYYIELEVIPLTDQGAEYTTIKDIRTQSWLDYIARGLVALH